MFVIFHKPDYARALKARDYLPLSADGEKTLTALRRRGLGARLYDPRSFILHLPPLDLIRPIHLGPFGASNIGLAIWGGAETPPSDLFPRETGVPHESLRPERKVPNVEFRATSGR